MDDVIYRQDAIDALWKALYDYEDKTEKQFLKSEELNTDDWFRHRIFVQNMSNIDIQTILKLPSAQQWIPCSERLPEIGQTVITSSSLGRVREATYKGFYRWRIDGVVRWTDEILNWRPLSKPYKGENDG